MVRRIRYAAKVSHHRSNEIRDIHVLAYDVEGAIRTLSAHGYLVLDPPKPAPRRKRAEADDGPRWEVDPRAIRAACDALGVSWEVKIRRTSSARTNGVHRLRIRNGKPVHYITGPKWADVSKATATLWHELTHAAQAERETAGHHDPSRIARAWNVFVSRQNNYPYRVRPIEVEARATAENPPLPIPLVREVRA